ncbi:hypothetical protein [Mesomycoplasma hyorhinis]|nr:hypothetical protein [Mesomycoplasma hyorhinis]
MKISLYDNKLSNFFISLLDKVDNLENIVLKDICWPLLQLD